MKYGSPGILCSALLVAACGGGGEGGGSGELRTPSPQELQAAISTKAVAPPPGAPLDQVGRWGGVGPWPLIPIHAALTPEGKVLTYGSTPTGQQTGRFDYDVWDAGSASIGAGHLTLPNTTATDLFCSAQVMLPLEGTMLLAGGDVFANGGTTNRGNPDATIFDPATNRLTTSPQSMRRSRWYATATTMPDATVFIQGGIDGEDFPERRNIDGTFTLLTGVPTRHLNYYYPRNFVAPDGLIFGYDVLSYAYRVDPRGAGTPTALGRISPVPVGEGSSAAMYAPGRILQGGATRETLTLDLNAPAPIVRPTAAIAVERRWLNYTVLPDGKVLATGGAELESSLITNAPLASYGASNAAEIWNPATGAWTVGAVAGLPRMYHSIAILLPDARVLTGGGGAPGPLLNTNAEIYSPPYLFSGAALAARPTILAAPTVVTPGAPFTLQVGDGAGIARVTMVKTGSVTHSLDMDQRFVEVAFTRSGDALTVTPPLSGADVPPGYYMIFVLNTAGTPSVARIARMNRSPLATVPRPWTTAVGGTAGTAFRAACAANEVLVGVAGRSGYNLDAVNPICVRAGPTGAWAGTPVARTVNGGPGGAAFTRQCPTNQAVSGLRGYSGVYVNQVQIQCQPLVGPQTLGGAQALLPAVGTAAGANVALQGCSNGFAANGLYGRASGFLNQMGLTCGRGLFEADGTTPPGPPPVDPPPVDPPPVDPPPVDPPPVDPPPAGVRIVGGPGGTPFALTCPAGAALAGISGGVGNWLDRIRPLCVARDGAGRWAGQPAAIAGTGGVGGADFTRRCPTDHFVAGIRGSAGSYIDRIEPLCVAPATGETAVTGPVGPALSAGSAPFVALQCGPGAIAQGLVGRSSGSLDALGIACQTVPTPALTPVVGGAAGTAYDGSCGPGEWLVGVSGGVGAWFDRVAPICARVGAAGTWTTTPVAGPGHGGGGGTPFTLQCPAGTVVKSAEGAAGIYLDRLTLACGPVAGGTTATTATVGPGYSTGSAAFAPLQCGAGAAARGIRGRASGFVDAMGLVCSGLPAATVSAHAGTVVPASTPVTLACGTGESLVGVAGGVGSWLDRVQPVCARVNAANTWLGTPVARGSAGGAGGAPFSLLCPTNHVVGALNGQAGQYVDRLGLTCVSATATLAPATFVGPGYSAGSAEFGSLSCPPTLAAKGLVARAPGFVETVQLACGRN